MIRRLDQDPDLEPIGDSAGLEYRRVTPDSLRSQSSNVVSQDSFDECCDYAWKTFGVDDLRQFILEALDEGGRRDLLRGDPVYVAFDFPKALVVSAGKGSDVLDVKVSRIDAPDRSGVAFEVTR